MLDRPTKLKEYQTYIDGKWCDAASGKNVPDLRSLYRRALGGDPGMRRQGRRQGVRGGLARLRQGAVGRP